jgi:hypothetical protein
VEKLVITRAIWRILCSTNGERNKQYACIPRRNFGPVVALTTFSSTEEAIAIANDTPYGLGAGVCLVMLTNYSKFHVLFKRVEFG